MPPDQPSHQNAKPIIASCLGLMRSTNVHALRTPTDQAPTIHIRKSFLDARGDRYSAWCTLSASARSASSHSIAGPQGLHEAYMELRVPTRVTRILAAHRSLLLSV